jgi:F-type H+-transporting ATPase subunit a
VLFFSIYVNSPLEQFEISKIYFFNSSFITAFFVFLIYWYTTNFLSTIYLLVPSRWQRFFELPFLFIKNIVLENISEKQAIYFPFILTYFILLLSYNLLGMVPYSFTVSSHLVVTLYLALTAFIGINIIALKKNNLAVFNLFLPKGVPLFIVPFLIIIELISYIARVFSLAIRLFANMMSGHTLLKILAGFSWSILNSGDFFLIFSLLPTVVIIAVSFLEVAIAFLQAYVFVILLCIYINDVLHLH